MSNIVKRIGSAALTVLVVVLVVLSIIISISSVTANANNGVPDLFGYTPFSVQTDSMEPTIAEGDYIFVEKCNAEELQVDDIVTYYTIIQGKRVINTHRIVEVYKSNNGMIQYQTKGDHNADPDKLLLSPGDVIGKYNGTRIPLLGSILDYLSTKVGFFLFILLPVLLFTLYQVYKLIMVIMHNKKIDMMEAVNENASDEVKEAIIAEYLAKQKLEEEKAAAASAEEQKAEQESEKEAEDIND